MRFFGHVAHAPDEDHQRALWTAMNRPLRSNIGEDHMVSLGLCELKLWRRISELNFDLHTVWRKVLDITV